MAIAATRDCSAATTTGGAAASRLYNKLFKQFLLSGGSRVQGQEGNRY